MSSRRLLRLILSAFLLSTACLLVVETFVWLSASMVRPPLQGLENQITDLGFQVRQQNKGHDSITAEQVVIIDIDDISIRKLGRAQLWPRSFDARAIAYVASGNPRGIGIDYLYTEPDTLSPEYINLLLQHGIERPEEVLLAMRTDSLLAAAVATAGNVYLSLYDDDARGDVKPDSASIRWLRTIDPGESAIRFPELYHPVLPIDAFSSGARAVGTIAMPSMQDGTIRYYRMLQRLPDSCAVEGLVGNFPFYMAMDALGVEEGDVVVSDHGVDLGSSLHIPLRTDGSFRINWLGSEEKIRYISYYKVLDELMPAEFFEGKYVFFGTSASGLEDLKTVPSLSNKMPGVEVHAIAFLNMMNGNFLREIGEREALPFFALIAFLLVLLFLAVRPLLGFVVALLLVFGEMMGFVLQVMPKYQVVFPIVTLMLLTFFCYLSATLYIYFTRERRNRRLRHAFGSYVSPEVVDQIVKDQNALHLGGEKKVLTVLFSDIRGFTHYSEQMDPQELVAALNHYLSEMSEVIFRHKGTIDKFIGDAIMAIFGAPIPQADHADRACRVALDMIQRLEEVNRYQSERGLSPLQIGIGLNTGEMTVGNIGSQKRFDYTVIGDAVNLGSRLESATKFFGVPILVAETTRSACTTNDCYFRELGSVIVKGKDHPVMLYQLVGYRSGLPGYEDELDRWRTALSAFRQRDLDRARALFEAFADAHPEDVPARIYLDLCAEFLAHPGQFSEVLKLESK